jgi:hypothetical protein
MAAQHCAVRIDDTDFTGFQTEISADPRYVTQSNSKINGVAQGDKTLNAPADRFPMRRGMR